MEKRPVCSYYVIKAKKIDYEKKKDMIKKCFEVKFNKKY